MSLVLLTAAGGLLGCGSTAAETASDTASPSAGPDSAGPTPDVPPADLGAEPAACDALRSLGILPLTVSGTRLMDSAGRQVLLRGVNAGGRSKFPPFLPFAYRESGLPTHATALPLAQAMEQYVDRVASWGLNVVRLPVTWEALEPKRGGYDGPFLDRYVALAEAFAARGIAVIVDIHQDVFSRVYCGDGFPLWALAGEVPELPTEGCEQWFNGYTSDPEVRAAFDRFWANEDGLRDAFSALWRMLAARMLQVSGVVALELLNEPGWGTRPSGEFLPEVLTPFYSELIAVVREITPTLPLLFDATGADAVVGQTALDLPAGAGLVFAPHYYDPTVILLGKWTQPDADYDALIGQWRVQADAWDVPVLLGEFGVRATAEGGAEYLQRNLAALDANLMSGTAWEYSDAPEDWNDEGMSVVSGGEETALVESLVRPYPAAVAGTLVSFAYTPSSGRAELVFDAAPGVTEVAAPTRLYPKGPTITVTGAESCTAYDAPAQRALVRTTAAGRVTVVLER